MRRAQPAFDRAFRELGAGPCLDPDADGACSLADVQYIMQCRGLTQEERAQPLGISGDCALEDSLVHQISSDSQDHDSKD